jgi:hypothetical protein
LRHRGQNRRHDSLCRHVARAALHKEKQSVPLHAENRDLRKKLIFLGIFVKNFLQERVTLSLEASDLLP